MRTISLKLALIGTSVTALCSAPCTVSAAPVTFTKLTGATGGSPAATAVYRADLSAVGLAEILSISIMDNSFGLGGAPGQFSGFDLDAIILSASSVDSASEADRLGCLRFFAGGHALHARRSTRSGGSEAIRYGPRRVDCR